METHPQYAAAQTEARKAGKSIYDFLNKSVDVLAKREGLRKRAHLTQHLHILPDFHGNRSPKADSTARGAIHGLSLHANFDDLTRLYYATIQAIAYGTRDIIDALNAKGYTINTILACGGG